MCVFRGLMIVVMLWCLPSFAAAHAISVKKNPTAESGIEWGVSDASGFVRWRAYIRGLTNNGQGQNSGWSLANGWWYYELDRIDQRVMFRMAGLENQVFEVTYWVFRSDGSWEFGEKMLVRHDNVKPTSQISSPSNGQVVSGDPQLQIAAQDLSGIAWIRLYLWAPSGYLPSGWSAGMDGVVHRDFNNVESLNHTLPSAPDGSYTLTAWVTDRAGNIAYEPWGRISFLVQRSSQPPPPPPPDEPDDEEPVPPPDEPNDDQVTPDEPDYSQTHGFEYPVDAQQIYRWENSIPNGSWYDYQPFGSLFNSTTKVHLGADINLAGSSDYGKPLYAVNHCIVQAFDDTTVSNAWGKYLMLRCDAPSGYIYRLQGAETAQTVYVLYAHLASISIVRDDGTSIAPSQIVRGQTQVAKGWRIGTIGNANGYYGTASHLHFEVKRTAELTPGPGYSAVDDPAFHASWIDPLEFIANNRVLHQRVQTIVVHPYVVNTHDPLHVELDAGVWRRQHREGTSERRSMGYGNYLWLAKSTEGTQASWNFFVPRTGFYDLFVYLPHSYATASKARYTVWHSGSNHPNPFVFELNQSRNPGLNERVFVGRFQFNVEWGYAVALQGSTEEVNPKYIAMDALELVFEHNDGTGGGFASIVDADQDLMDDAWEVSYHLDPANPSDAQQDADGDGLSNLMEYRLATDPRNVDTDADGYSDDEEYHQHYNPADPNDYPGSVLIIDDDLADDEDVADPVTDPVDDVPGDDVQGDGDTAHEYPSPVSIINQYGGFACSAGSSGSGVDLIIVFLVLFAVHSFRQRRLT